MPDSISGMSDADLKAMAANLWTTVNAAPTTYGLTAGFATALQGAVDDFDGKLGDHIIAQAAAKSKTAAKEASRDALEALVREARTLAKAAKVNEATYNLMGIPSSSSPAPSSATVPVTMVDTSERFRHTLSWTDASATGNKKKPRGVMGAEIWVKIGDPAPTDEKDCTYLALDAFTPYVSEYTAENVNKTAHYMLRWRMRDGTVSAWGETVSATITG